MTESERKKIENKTIKEKMNLEYFNILRDIVVPKNSNDQEVKSYSKKKKPNYYKIRAAIDLIALTKNFFNLAQEVEQ